MLVLNISKMLAFQEDRDQIKAIRIRVEGCLTDDWLIETKSLLLCILNCMQSNTDNQI